VLFRSKESLKNTHAKNPCNSSKGKKPNPIQHGQIKKIKKREKAVQVLINTGASPRLKKYAILGKLKTRVLNNKPLFFSSIH
jgi:hypothetical protein